MKTPPYPFKMQIKLLIFFFLKNFFFVRDENFEKITNLRCNHLSSKKKLKRSTHTCKHFFFPLNFFTANDRPVNGSWLLWWTRPPLATPTGLVPWLFLQKKKLKFCWWFFSCTFRVCVCVCYFAAIFFFFEKTLYSVCELVIARVIFILAGQRKI